MLGKLLGFTKKSSKKSVKSSHGGKAGNFKFLGTDMHSHLIPGIDDGPAAMETSVEMVRQMQKMGFKSLVTTPHIRAGHYPNTAQTINEGLQNLNKALADNNIDMPVRAAAEYFVDEYFVELLNSGERLLTLNEKEVLIEFTFVFEPGGLNKIIKKMLDAGYTPVIAHAERYTFYHSNSDKYRELKDKGCMLQLNLTSAEGYYGSKVKNIANTLLESGLYDYCGTDAHHDKHMESLEKLLYSPTLSDLQKYPFLNSKL